MSSSGPEFNPVMQTEEPLTPFDVTRTSERAGLLKLGLGFGVLLLIAFIVLKLYQPGTRDRGDPPVITAENTPFKIIPDDQEGVQTPDQDKEVFDVMSGQDTREDVITLPPPETPVERPNEADITPGPTDDTASVETVDTPPVERPSVDRPAVDTPVTRPDPTPTQPAPTPPAKGNSDWVVQVASLRSQAEAESTYAAIERANGAILSAFRSDIVRVDLADKGVYYRARVVGFASKQEADRTCERLKSADQSCFVTRR